MFVQIQTVDGQFFASDNIELVDSGLDVQQWDDLWNSVADLLSDWSSMEHIALEIGGRKRYFNPRNILWAEVVA